MAKVTGLSHEDTGPQPGYLLCYVLGLVTLQREFREQNGIMEQSKYRAQCPDTEGALSTHLVFVFLCKDESPTGRKATPPRPGAGF